MCAIRSKSCSTLLVKRPVEVPVIDAQPIMGASMLGHSQMMYKLAPDVSVRHTTAKAGANQPVVDTLSHKPHQPCHVLADT
jgi:hypothetical protein